MISAVFSAAGEDSGCKLRRTLSSNNVCGGRSKQAVGVYIYLDDDSTTASRREGEEEPIIAIEREACFFRLKDQL